MYEKFSAFKVQVLKEFLFLKHLIETSSAMENKNNKVDDTLVAENKKLKRENEKLKEWIDNLFKLAKMDQNKTNQVNVAPELNPNYPNDNLFSISKTNENETHQVNSPLKKKSVNVNENEMRLDEINAGIINAQNQTSYQF